MDEPFAGARDVQTAANVQDFLGFGTFWRDQAAESDSVRHPSTSMRAVALRDRGSVVFHVTVQGGPHRKTIVAGSIFPARAIPFSPESPKACAGKLTELNGATRSDSRPSPRQGSACRQLPDQRTKPCQIQPWHVSIFPAPIIPGSPPGPLSTIPSFAGPGPSSPRALDRQDLAKQIRRRPVLQETASFAAVFGHLRGPAAKTTRP